MRRHIKQQPRGQGQGRGQARGQGRGLGREDRRYIHQNKDARNVAVVNKDMQNKEIIPNWNPTSETRCNLGGHPLDKRTVRDLVRTSRKDRGTGNDAGVKLGTSRRYGSQEHDGMRLGSMSRSGKRLHPDNKSSGPGFFRNDRSRSPDWIRIKKHKRNVDKEDDSFSRRYVNQPVRGNLPLAQIGANMRKYSKGNKNVHGRMQFESQRYKYVTTTSAEPIDSEERLKVSSTAEKEDLASLILRTVCVDYLGMDKVDLANLRKTLHQKNIFNFSNTRTLYDFLKQYDNVFEIEGNTDGDVRVIEDGEVEETAAEDKFLVTGHPNLLLCQQHSRKAGSCTQDCRSLHICKYFVLSKCTRKTCIFDHDMDTEHNKEVLRKSLLHTFKTKSEIDVLRSLKYRNSTTVPAICSYYNKPKVCNKAECGFMHVCSKFFHGTCSAPHMCNLSHDIKANQPLQCLQRYGISPLNFDEREVIKTLKSIVNKENHPLDQGRQVQCSIETQGTLAGGYKKYIPKPSKGHQVTRYFAPIGCSKSEKMKVPEKFTKANNQNRQVRVEVEEGQEKEQEVNLRNSLRGVWTWSWKNQDGAWSDVTDSQIFEARYKEYMHARKRSFIINGKMCQVDFAKKTGVINGEVALSFKRVRKPECDPKCSTSDITDDNHVVDVAGSGADVAIKTDIIDGEVALDIKTVVKPECDATYPPPSDLTAVHVTAVAGSDADVATKTRVTDGEVELDIKRFEKPECDTKCSTSYDIMDDSHVTNAAGSDADVSTKTEVTDGEVKLDSKSLANQCVTSDITHGSHVSKVAGSDGGAAVEVVDNGTFAQDCNRLPSATQ